MSGVHAGSAGIVLNAALDGHSPATTWTADEVTTARARWRADVDAERPGIVPICDALREVHGIWREGSSF